ncbi:hypothetical protein KIN20_014566 [Parelaphostrongylus tenuis]|uniref:Uncharacterized protein n=1 Tax=Parelaphostrongylus tenuis TaxID=148309 RepID=A0AAD5MDS8_PARTN|nr:hypothetical protein KIN20_014566 [Parelaphostrongylus tenuis]
MRPWDDICSEGIAELQLTRYLTVIDNRDEDSFPIKLDKIKEYYEWSKEERIIAFRCEKLLEATTRHYTVREATNLATALRTSQHSRRGICPSIQSVIAAM